LNYTRISSHFTAASTTLVYNSTNAKNCQIIFKGFSQKNPKKFKSCFLQKNITKSV